MASQETPNYRLSRWAGTDRILMEEFNSDNEKIDAALKGNAEAVAAETAAREAANSYVKLLDMTLQENTQKWNIDLSGIDLTKYQKLVIYPHLLGDNNQWVYIHFDDTAPEYGNVPMVNDPTRQNFGMCEYSLLIELPKLYLMQIGTTSNVSSSKPSFGGYNGPILASGVTHLNTLGFWFDNSSYRLLKGSAVQIYGLKK